jgi:hypothetical protein
VRTKLALALTVVLLAAGLALFYQASAEATRGGEDSPLYSTERHDPYGTAALKDLLSERGVATTVLERPTLGDESGAVLIQVLADAGHDAPHLQAEALKEWLSKGNTLIQFTRTATDLMSAYHLEAAQPVENLKDIESAEGRGKRQDEVPAQRKGCDWIALPRLSDRETIVTGKTLQVYTPLLLQAAKGHETQWQPLAVTRDDDEDWIAASARIGPGRLIVVGTPTPVLNGTLAEGSNLEFVLRLIAPDGKMASTVVIFDEWSHGLGHAGTIVGFMRDVGLLPVVFQLFVVVALYVWATAGYTPPPRAPVRRRRSSVEQIETLGYLYRQSLQPGLVFEKVYREVRRRLAEGLGCTPASLEAALAHAPPAVRARAQHLLRSLDQIGRAQGPLCPRCGYDLTGNDSGRCPECGAEVPLAVRERIAAAAPLVAVPERRPSSRKDHAQLAAVLRESYLFVEGLHRGRHRRR